MTSSSCGTFFCLGNLCTPTSNAPDDQRCSTREVPSLKFVGSKSRLNRPRRTVRPAALRQFLGEVQRAQLSPRWWLHLLSKIRCLVPSIQWCNRCGRLQCCRSFWNRYVSPRCQSSCANAADQPAMLPKLDVSAYIQPLGPGSAARITPQTMRFTILGGGGTKLAALCLIYCALHSNLALFVFISSHRHQIIDLVFCLLVLRCPLTVQTRL